MTLVDASAILSIALTVSETLSTVLAASAISPINGITPIASSPADTKSPRNKSTGIDARFVNVSAPGIKEATAKTLLMASRVLHFVFPKLPPFPPPIKQSPAFWILKIRFQKK